MRTLGRLPHERPWRRRSRHSVSAHETALRLYQELGLREASRRSGIPQRTLARWAKDARLEPPASAARTAAATEGRKAAATRRQRAACAAIYGLTLAELDAFLSASSLPQARQKMAEARLNLAA